MAERRTISSLVLDEAFARQDENFVELLHSFHDPKKLATFADRWAKDPRPWARQKIIEYINSPWNSGGHEPLVKRLFKYAEGQRDDELMAHFLVRLDRIVRRKRKERWQWDSQLRQSSKVEVLVTPDGFVPKGLEQRFDDIELFKYRTRYYLRRRAWRYFRRMGFQQPPQYVPSITKGLIQYRDEDLEKGENLLDSWGLIHICFGKSDAIEFGPLPKTSTGKVQKFLLREREWAGQENRIGAT